MEDKPAITAKGDSSLIDFLQWSIQCGHHPVEVAYRNYDKYCQYVKEVKGTLSEKQRYVEE